MSHEEETFFEMTLRWPKKFHDNLQNLSQRYEKDLAATIRHALQLLDYFVSLKERGVKVFVGEDRASSIEVSILTKIPNSGPTKRPHLSIIDGDKKPD